MRTATIVALAALFGLIGCAYGGPGTGIVEHERDAGWLGPTADAALPHADAGPAHDAGPPGTDAGHTTATGRDASVATGTDAGTVAAIDAGTTTGSDAGATETDAGTPPIDLGPGIPGDTCVSALDVSVGGSWMVDTCSARDDIAAGCGIAGTPDLVLRGAAPMTGSTYQIHVGAGWVIQQVSAACAPMPFSCGASDWGVSGATFDPYWMWAIERADGSCGMVTINVDRVM